MNATTLSFRVGHDFAEQTRTLSKTVGLKRSDYIREAVREKNELVMSQHIATLSKALSAEHRDINKALEGALADGIE